MIKMSVPSWSFRGAAFDYARSLTWCNGGRCPPTALISDICACHDFLRWPRRAAVCQRVIDAAAGASARVPPPASLFCLALPHVMFFREPGYSALMSPTAWRHGTAAWSFIRCSNRRA